MKRFMIVLCVAVVVIFSLANAHAAVYTQGFEGSGYNFYADSGSWSGVQSTVVHSGLQGAQFTLGDTRFAYTRWKSEDISSYGFTLGNVIASDWVMRDYGRSDLSPFFIFSVSTPNNPDPDGTLVIQFSMASIADDTWTQNNIDRAATTFHVNGDRTGLTAGTFSPSGTQSTLDQLAATTYSGSIKWGDLPVHYIRTSVGLWDAAQTWNGYVDDVTVGAVPEPSTIIIWSLLGMGSWLGMRVVRRRRGGPVGRQPWSPENRQAIHNIIARGARR